MSYAAARTIGVDEIPVIDVAPLFAPGDAGTLRVAQAMRAAAQATGFFYIRNHGIPPAVITAAEGAARTFFAQPLEAKLAAKPTDRHRGFLRVGEAKMDNKARADLKESFVWGLDVPADDPDYLAGNRMIGPNNWPAGLPAMRPALNAYFDAAHVCGRALFRAFAASLDVDPDYFTHRFGKPVSRGTLVYYPPQPPELGPEQFGVAPHTDYGCLTLLHQDDVGGLEVRARCGEWVTAHPIAGTLVVNIGDLMGRWTNDRFVSTPHRVVNRSGRERFSIAMFVDPDFDTLIQPVCAPGESAHYQPVTCGDYILGRFDASFSYRQPAA